MMLDKTSRTNLKKRIENIHSTEQHNTLFIFVLMCPVMEAAVITARQRSCGKVMFSQVCVILLTPGGGYTWSRFVSESVGIPGSYTP